MHLTLSDSPIRWTTLGKDFGTAFGTAFGIAFDATLVAAELGRCLQAALGFFKAGFFAIAMAQREAT